MNITLKKIVPLVFILVISIAPFSTSKGNSEIFDKYGSKTCPKTIHLMDERLIRDCITGQPIRIEYSNERVLYTSESLSYCDGGWGWCIGEEEQPCPPQDQYQTNRLPDGCE